jgi:catechol 2,3-dioxygenase-like lactoylglutathione lyase family enzyme
MTPSSKEQIMLASKDVMATIAVKDIDVAKKFYGEILGLKLLPGDLPEVLTYQSGQACVVVYTSEFAATNRATSATWSVGDEFDAIIKMLQGRGVKFEHYDMPEGQLEGDVHVMGDYKGAWFKDPDGNILHVLNQ